MYEWSGCGEKECVQNFDTEISWTEGTFGKHTRGHGIILKWTLGKKVVTMLLAGACQLTGLASAVFNLEVLLSDRSASYIGILHWQ
jgi:hypothetical protein